VGCFLIEKQKVVLFPTFKENEGEGKGRETARNALRQKPVIAEDQAALRVVEFS